MDYVRPCLNKTKLKLTPTIYYVKVKCKFRSHEAKSDTAPLGRDSEQEMDTRGSPVGVDKADMLVQLCYLVCSLGLAEGYVQTLCITFAEVSYDERTLSPQHPGSALR